MEKKYSLGLKELLLSRIKDILYDIAEKLKKIPIIGTAIGTAIQKGIKSTEKQTEKTLEKTTTNAIDKSKPEINSFSQDAGEEASLNYIKAMKEKFDNERTNLSKTISNTIEISSNNSKSSFELSGNKNATSYTTNLESGIEKDKNNLKNSIERTITNASNNSTAIANQNGTMLGNNEMFNMKLAISNSQNSLTSNITDTIRTASNQVDTSSAGNVGSSVGENIKWGFERTNLGYYMRRIGSNLGSELGDNISDNMKVEGSTLGRTLNNAISTAISRIKNNNWSLFGSNGILSNLLNFKWSFFADGGFPTEGDFFFANEQGPELVGSINGHSAVANNDQIIKGIQGGVFNAMMSALNNTDFGGSQVTIEANGDTEGLLNFIEFKQKQKSRQFN